MSAATSETLKTPIDGRRALVVLNLVGGSAVLGSYLIALVLAPDIRSGLWGGVPDSLRGVYTTCMFLAAAGYFPFTYHLVWKQGPSALARDLASPAWLLAACYAAILIPSALWLPLTAIHLDGEGAILWGSIRLVLLLVGLGSTGIVWLAWRLGRVRGGASWSALVGSLPFWFQTAILDAVIWPAYYPGGMG